MCSAEHEERPGVSPVWSPIHMSRPSLLSYRCTEVCGRGYQAEKSMLLIWMWGKMNNPSFFLVDFQGITTSTTEQICACLLIVCLVVAMINSLLGSKGDIGMFSGRQVQKCFLVCCRFITSAFRSFALARKQRIDLIFTSECSGSLTGVTWLLWRQGWKLY